MSQYDTIKAQAKSVISQFGNNNIKLENAGRTATISGVLLSITEKNRPSSLVAEATRVLYLSDDLSAEFLEPGTTAKIGSILYNVVQVDVVNPDGYTDILYKAYLST